MIKKSIIAITVTLLIVAATIILGPPGWVRKSKALVEMAIVVDTSGSNADNLPAATEGVAELTRHLSARDRLALFSVGAQVQCLFQGEVPHRNAMQMLREDVISEQLQPRRGDDGTDLREGLWRVTDAFEKFDEMPNHLEARTRVVVIYSDGQNTAPGGEPIDLAGVSLPDHLTVVVIGFKGIHRDSVVQALQGRAGNNDVHVVAAASAKQAIESVVRAMGRARPIALSKVAVAGAAAGLLGLLATILLSLALARKSDGMTVTLGELGRALTAQDFPLYKGDSLAVGSGPDVDFQVSGDARCYLRLKGKSKLAVAPGAGEVHVRNRAGIVPVVAEQTLSAGDSLLFGDTEIELSAN